MRNEMGRPGTVGMCARDPIYAQDPQRGKIQRLIVQIEHNANQSWQ